MPSQQSISAAVGRQPARNVPSDQQTIINLLHRVLPEDGGPGVILPGPTPGGQANPALISAIVQFQRKHAPKNLQDGRVEPRGLTIDKLNEFARSVFPVDPLVFPPDLDFPPKPTRPGPAAPPSTPVIMRALGFQATNWKMTGSASLSGSLGPTGAVLTRFNITEFLVGESDEHIFDFAGVALGHGPLPFGIEIGPSFFPSIGSQVYAHKPNPTTADFKGPLTLISGATNVGIPAGPNFGLLAFGVRAGSSGESVANLLRHADMVAAVGGLFAGVSIGVSLVVGALA